MKQKLILISIFFLIVISIIAYLYFFYEKKIQEENINGYKNISVSAIYGNSLIEVDYDIYINNIFYEKGQTLKQGSVLKYIPLNQTFRLLFFKDKYYNYLTKEYYSSDKEVIRIEAGMRPIGDLDIVSFGTFGIDNNLSMLIKANGYISPLILCIKWSFNVFNVEVIDYEIIDNPSIYKNYDKCYNLRDELDNSKKIINFNYMQFGELKESDFIDFVFVDSQNTINELIYEDNGKDIGMIDKNFTFSL